jgi:hypothetical protein
MADSPIHYVALGDSISIDDYSGGPGRGGASLLFANRDGDFPDWRGRDLRTAEAGAVFSLLATDGATCSCPGSLGFASAPLSSPSRSVGTTCWGRTGTRGRRAT